MSTISRSRSSLYRAARLLGDAEALASGDPRRMGKRAVNKMLGRRLVRHIWVR